jgi:hypothetical protein
MISRTSQKILSCCVVLTALATASAQPAAPTPAAPAPATAPATTQAAIVPTDQNSPRGTLKLLMVSMNKGDLDTAKGIFAPANEVETKMVNAILGQQQAMLDYRQAAIKAFGDEDARKLVGDVAGDEAKGMALIDQAQEQVNGDSATVSDGQQSITLKKQAGKWVFPISSVAPDINASTIDNAVSSIGEQKKLLADVTTEITSGKYKTVDDAGRALQMKMMQAAMAHEAGATTQPTTAPAKAPAPAAVGPQ